MSHPFSVEDTPSCLDPKDLGVSISSARERVSGDLVDIDTCSEQTVPRSSRWNGIDRVVTEGSELGHSETIRRASSADTLQSPIPLPLEQQTRTKNPSENDEYGFMEIAWLILSRRLLTFAQNASIVGLVDLVRPSSYAVCSVLRKVVWVILLLFGVVVMGIQIQGRIDYFRTRPTIAKYQLMQGHSLRFPTVTICMENRLRRQVVQGLGQGVVDVVAKVMPPFPDVNFHPDYKSYNSNYWDVNWGDLYRLMAPPMQEVLLQCEFKTSPCDLAESMKPISTDLGFCFSFNSAATHYMTTEPGANYGLRLVLWTNQSDYLVTWSPAAGFRVYLHDPDETPLMKSGGFKVSVGMSTVVSFSFKNVSQLPSPYGDCRDSANYTFNGCMTNCEGQYILSHCSCRLAESPVLGPVCNAEQVFDCALTTQVAFISSGASKKCDCPLQCNQRTYPYSITTSPLSQLFLDYTMKKPDFKGRKLPTKKLSRELAYLEIYFSQLTYTNIQTIPAYSVLSLFCDIGCALGLILGCTFLTIFEILQLSIGLLMDLVASVRLAHLQRAARKSTRKW